MTFKDVRNDRIVACRRLIAARAVAIEHLSDVVGRDRSWDGLQHLYLAKLERREFLQSWFAPELPAKAHRISRRLRALGLVVTNVDPRDHRRIVVDLTDGGEAAMETVVDYLISSGFADSSSDVSRSSRRDRC